MSALDRITRELAEVQDRLLALGREHWAERYELQKRQDELRDEAAEHRTSRDGGRSTEDLQDELDELRHRVKQLVVARTGYILDMGDAAGTAAAEVAKLVSQSRGATDLDRMVVRISEIEAELAGRIGSANPT
jgi:chromosome segregation ATPase